MSEADIESLLKELSAGREKARIALPSSLGVKDVYHPLPTSVVDSGIFMLYTIAITIAIVIATRITLTSRITLTATAPRWRRNQNRRRLLQIKYGMDAIRQSIADLRNRLESVERRPSESAEGAPIEMRLAHLSQRVETVAEALESNRIALEMRITAAVDPVRSHLSMAVREISEALTNVQMERDQRQLQHRHDAHLAQIRSERIRLDEAEWARIDSISRLMPRGKCSQ